MSTSKSAKAAPKTASSQPEPKNSVTPGAQKPPAKPLQAKSVIATKPAPKGAAPKPEPKTVPKLTSAPKPKPDAKPAAKPKAAPKLEAKEVPKAPKPAAKVLPHVEPPAPPPPAAPVAAAPPPPAPTTHSGVVAGPMRPMTPPRAMAKAEIFVDGDFVVYPTHGVGKVERIATEEIAGHTLELIHITFDENRMTLRVPTNKARTAGLRKLASAKQFADVLATLKGRARIKRTMWSRRAQEYEAKINSGDPQAIAEVVRDLHRNAGQPDQSFSERQIYESALDRLAAEYAALEKVDKATATERLIAHLKSE
jgi:CarD family transcriptional regulator